MRALRSDLDENLASRLIDLLWGPGDLFDLIAEDELLDVQEDMEDIEEMEELEVET